MSYTLSEIKIAAYNYSASDGMIEEPPNMEWWERAVWLGAAYAYDLHKYGQASAEECKAILQSYIDLIWRPNAK